MDIYSELDKLDTFLGLPAGTACAVLADHDCSRVAVINDRLAAVAPILGADLRLDADTAVARACRPAWAAAMQRLGISRAWWYTGDPSLLEPAAIPSLADLKDLPEATDRPMPAGGPAQIEEG